MIQNTPILVVDNDPETTRRIENILRPEGYLVFVAPTESLAITTAKEIEPSLIFVSLSIPDGLEICRKIHSIETLSEIPIIILTSQEKRVNVRYGAEFGIVDSLDKSFSPGELVLKTETVLSIKEITEKATSRAPDIPQYELSIEPVIGDISMERFKESPRVVKELRNSVPSYEDVEGLIDNSFKLQKENPPQNKGRKIVLEKKRPIIPAVIGAVILISALAFFFIWQWGGFEIKTLLQQKPSVKTEPPKKKEQIAEPKPSDKPPVPETPTVETPKVIIGILPKDPLKEPPLKDAPLKETLKEKPVKERSFYSAQVGAFKNIENAEAITERLKKNGYDAFIHSITRGNEKVHRVLVGKFEEKKEAEKLASTLKTKEDISALVFSFDSLKNP